MFTRILVPTDFSAPADAALDCARGLAARLGSSLHLIHVLEDPFLSAPIGSEVYIEESPAVREALLKDAQTRLEGRITPQDRVRFAAVGEVVHGAGARTIVEYAAANGMSLIVMGTHGRSGLAHVLMGSVAERVVRTATCPVLTVRQVPEKADAPAAAAVAALA